MGTMRDIKRRIRSIQNTQQITKAMKMVAAAKLRRTQDKVVAARPYADKLRETLARLVSGAESVDHPLLTLRDKEKVGFVVFAGDRGLCGGYNSNILRLAGEAVAREEAVRLMLPVGRKARDHFRRRGAEIITEFIDIGDEPNFIQAREMAQQLVSLFVGGKLDEVQLVYTKFHSALRHEPMAVRLLPLATPEASQGGTAVDYIYEPTAAVVLEELLPRYVETQVYQSLLESKTSEHGARMTAMDSATQNADEMIEDLTLSFNKARQAAITKELLEIVGTAQAL